MLCQSSLYSKVPQIHTYIFFFKNILFQYVSFQEIKYSSLCYTVGPCCLSILNVIVCIYQSQTPSPFLSLFLGNHKSDLCLPHPLLKSPPISLMPWAWRYPIGHQHSHLSTNPRCPGPVYLWHLLVGLVDKRKQRLIKHCLESRPLRGRQHLNQMPSVKN